MPGVNKSCLPWIICGIFLAVMIFLAMKLCMEYSEEIYGEKPEPKKQINEQK